MINLTKIVINFYVFKANGSHSILIPLIMIPIIGLLWSLVK